VPVHLMMSFLEFQEFFRYSDRNHGFFSDTFLNFFGGDFEHNYRIFFTDVIPGLFPGFPDWSYSRITESSFRHILKIFSSILSISTKFSYRYNVIYFSGNLTALAELFFVSQIQPRGFLK